MPYYYGHYMDPTYLLVIVGFLLTLFASFGVKATFAKYRNVGNARGCTAAMAARRILDANGLQNVQIERVRGELTDHFDPRAGVVRLSDATYDSVSVGSIGVAAHECGHAIQYATGYAPIKIRNRIVPVVNIGNSLSMPLFLIGLLLGRTEIAMAGVLLFSLVLIFQLVTLPVEFNASMRAMKILEQSDMLYGDELKGAGKVLRAAAMTYVAAVASTCLQLLRLLLIVGQRNRRD